MADSHVIRCKTLELTLDAAGRAVSLKIAPDGVELLAAGSPPTGLWSAGLIRPVCYDDPLPRIEIPAVAYEGHEWWANRHEYRADVALDADDASPPIIESTHDGLTLHWTLSLPGAGRESANPPRVTLRIKGGAAADRIEFTCDVSLPDTWAVKRVTFPRIRGFGDPRAPHLDRLLYPENWGVLRHNPLEDMTNYIGQYPGAANWCQMIAWMHGRAGVYVGVIDPDTHHTGIDAQYVEGDTPAPWETERWHLRDAGLTPPKWTDTPLAERVARGVKPAVQVRCNHWPAMTSRWQCPYPVALEGFSGTWYDAARIHRAWALKQRWCRRGRLADRADASKALLGLDLWFSRYGFHPASLEPKPAWEFRDAMRDLHEFFGMPFGVHWYHWHAFSWHRQFPAHSPVVEGFAEVREELRSRGIVVMPYCQGRLLYRDRAGIETERSHASVESNGQPYLEMYTPEDHWPLALCANDAWSQTQWREAARLLWRHYGVEGVYFDQITAMPPSLCYHAGHGHELGGGTHYWRGYDDAMASMQGMIEEDHNRFLSSELMADAFMDRIDLYLAFVPPLEDYVPLFSAIYGGYTVSMGRATPESAMASPQLFAMIHGEQLLFGGQVGWMNEAILKYPQAAKYLRDLARLRSRVRDLLQLGTLEASLDDVGAGETIDVTIPTSLCAKGRPVRVRRPAIVNTVWRGHDGRVLVMLLNECERDITATLTRRDDWPAGEWRVWRLAEPNGQTLVFDRSVTFTIPPLSVLAIESVGTPGTN